MTTSIAGAPPCCPISLGEVCWDSGTTTGRAYAIYDPTTSTTIFHDTITNGVIPANQIVTCPNENAATPVNGVVAFQRVTAGGTVTAGKASVSIGNAGEANGTVLGSELLPGEAITFNAYVDTATHQFVRVPAIAYNATGTVFHITTQD